MEKDMAASDKKSVDQAIEDLYDVIASRKNSDSGKSYTKKLFDKGREKICQKVGEEATETIIAALKEPKKALVSESADLLYHLLVLWADRGVKPQEVSKELQRRMGISGLKEKAARGVLASKPAKYKKKL